MVKVLKFNDRAGLKSFVIKRFFSVRQAVILRKDLVVTPACRSSITAR